MSVVCHCSLTLCSLTVPGEHEGPRDGNMGHDAGCPRAAWGVARAVPRGPLKADARVPYAQAFGNGIVATVAGIDVLSDARTDVFFGYAAAMTAAALAFMWMGRNFQYTDTAAASVDLIVGDVSGAEWIDVDTDKL